MRILVTNDDGVHAPGLWALVRALKPLGEVIVSAPDRDRSGIGSALTLRGQIRAVKLLSRVDGVDAHAVDGTPGDAVLLGLNELAGGPVDLVVSGINHGNNGGEEIPLSGTVGAALHAHLNGIPALAVSTHTAEDADADLVGSVLRAMAPGMVNIGAATPLFLNLNFPVIDPASCARHRHEATNAPTAGVRLTTLFPGPVFDNIAYGWGDGHLPFWNTRRLELKRGDVLPADSDLFALVNGYVSVTPLNDNLSRGSTSAAVDTVIKMAAEAISTPG